MRPLLVLLFISAFGLSRAQDPAPVPVFGLEQYQARVLQPNDTLYVVNFWATWCKPCVQELPYFEALRQKLAGQPVKFILVSNDMKTAGLHVAKFLKKNHYTAEAFILSAGNPNVWIDQIEPKWTGTIPATILYRGGQKLAFTEGEFPDLPALEKFINFKE